MTDLTKIDAPRNPAETMRDALERHLPGRVHETQGVFHIETAGSRSLLDITDEIVTERERRRLQGLFQPERRTGTARHDTLDSLIAWVNRNKGDESVLFLDASNPAKPVLHCVVNYHFGGPPELPEPTPGASAPSEWCESTARHGDHRGLYQFPISRAWSRWSEHGGAMMSVADFGAFIEDNARDLLDPTPFIASGETPVGDDEEPVAAWEVEARQVAHRLKGDYATVSRMIDLGRNFTVNVEARASVKADRQSGRANLILQEEHTDEEGVKLVLPRLFLIAIPVFEMGDLFPLVCTFSYRASGPKLSFALYDQEHAFETALREAAEKVRDATGLPLFYGRPETGAAS